MIVIAPAAVLERVVDEVPERLLDPRPVDPRHGRLVRVDHQRAPLELGPRTEAVANLLHDVHEVGRLRAQRQRPLLGAREDEQVVGDPRQPVRLLGRGADGVLELLRRARPAQRQLELGAKRGERSSELVARVGDEAALSLEPVLEPPEHLVERPSEPRDLVVRRWYGQPLVERGGGDLVGAPAHRLDRPERRAREQVPAERHQQKAIGPPTRKAAWRLVERLVAMLERGADDEHVAPAAGSASMRAGLVLPRQPRRRRTSRSSRRGELGRREQRPAAEAGVASTTRPAA